VVEVGVVRADKGTALQALREELGADAVAYFGDDVTDEDAFRALGPDDVTVKVGEGATAARFRVDGPEDAAAALIRLHELRATR
jgi:trehalose 6-phosphate phosphatase